MIIRTTQTLGIILLFILHSELYAQTTLNLK